MFNVNFAIYPVPSPILVHYKKTTVFRIQGWDEILSNIIQQHGVIQIERELVKTF